MRHVNGFEFQNDQTKEKRYSFILRADMSLFFHTLLNIQFGEYKSYAIFLLFETCLLAEITPDIAILLYANLCRT